MRIITGGCTVATIRAGRSGIPPDGRRGRRMGAARGFEREVTTMIGSVLNLLFRCPHQRITRPVTPIGMDGKPQGDAYVVCLACGKQFLYDWKQMHIGKPLRSNRPSHIPISY